MRYDDALAAQRQRLPQNGFRIAAHGHGGCTQSALDPLSSRRQIGGSRGIVIGLRH
jgi:hypothetical protein